MGKTRASLMGGLRESIRLVPAQPDARPRTVIRARGYVRVVTGWAVAMLAIATTAFLDPELEGLRDPDWMYWLCAIVFAALIARAPFVGVVVGDDTVRRRSWLRTQTWAVQDVYRVGSSGYSGALTRYATSKRYRMVVLVLRHGKGGQDLPELSGRPATVERLAAALSGALGLEQTKGPRS